MVKLLLWGTVSVLHIGQAEHGDQGQHLVAVSHSALINFRQRNEYPKMVTEPVVQATNLHELPAAEKVHFYGPQRERVNEIIRDAQGRATREHREVITRLGSDAEESNKLIRRLRADIASLSTSLILARRDLEHTKGATL